MIWTSRTAPQVKGLCFCQQIRAPSSSPPPHTRNQPLLWQACYNENHPDTGRNKAVDCNKVGELLECRLIMASFFPSEAELLCGCVPQVLCSVPDVKASVDEIRRVLKPGGKAYFLEHTFAEPSRPLMRQGIPPLQTSYQNVQVSWVYHALAGLWRGRVTAVCSPSQTPPSLGRFPHDEVSVTNFGVQAHAQEFIHCDYESSSMSITSSVRSHY